MVNLSITEAINFLKEKNFNAYFEGDICVKMMPLTLEDVENNGELETLKQEIDFIQRPNKEKLLRQIIYQLFEMEYIDKHKSIIDVGCWIGDNAIPWSFFIENAVVHAIDPSEKNLNFAKNIASLNGKNNINWVKSVCSDIVGEKLSFNGTLEQASFKKNITNDDGIVSNTLDNIINNSLFKKISLMHIDVEGFEKQTIKGALEIIYSEKPVIIFEQHICSENSMEIIKLLKGLDYNVFMINEILPGCQLDCRNFIAFNKNRKIPKLPKLNHALGRQMNIFYASLDEALIKVT